MIVGNKPDADALLFCRTCFKAPVNLIDEFDKHLLDAQSGCVEEKIELGEIVNINLVEAHKIIPHGLPSFAYGPDCVL